MIDDLRDLVALARNTPQLSDAVSMNVIAGAEQAIAAVETDLASLRQENVLLRGDNVGQTQQRNQFEADLTALRQEQERLRDALEYAIEACRKARMVIGNDLRLVCRHDESDRECLNRSIREALSALGNVLGSGNGDAKEHAGSTRRSAAK